MDMIISKAVQVNRIILKITDNTIHPCQFIADINTAFGLSKKYILYYIADVC